MHDIGKTAIPVEVLNKPTKLDTHELWLVRQHALEGYRYLTKYAIGDEQARRAVLFHHERYDGTGYPNGLKGEEIPLVSRIISVADVYDALTSMRPYRLPIAPGEAIEYIMANAGTAFDYGMVTALLQRLELYPVGSLVELSNGEIAKVLCSANSLRPVVQLIRNGEVGDLFRDYAYLNVTVKRVLSDQELPAAQHTLPAYGARRPV
jgi:HD-GYP domain-containing protein (c-di-GMP phosphodiesterase class II)